ncbi:hypothetical protein AB0E55_37430 [Amycolatopsis keratiniphila]|uniref:hypothetical protein n=1 Tax=Amycolatopsis keratiniphila TaxID=129921 RepID=UPI0033DC08B9
MIQRRTILLGVLLAGAPLAGLSPATPAFAKSTVNILSSSEAARKLVRRIAGRDPRAAVRADAWVAWAADDDWTIEEFLENGLPAAERRAAETNSVNSDFCRRILSTYTAEFAPEVHAAAQRALLGSDTDRAAFVAEGFAAAEARDRRVREDDGAQERAIVEEDRRYIRELGAADPGPHVRAAAAWALRPGSTDADLVEFFAYGWATAARLDLEAHRLRDAEQEARRQVAIRRLITGAREAEQAALEAADEIAEQARMTAANAWRKAAGQAAPAKTGWTDAEKLARAQAANWRAVAEAAANATGPNWKAIAVTAGDTATEWSAEQDWADGQTRFWADLLQQALDGETRMTSPRA